MSMRSATTDWVTALAPRTVFTSNDAPGTPSAVDSALSRLASDPDGPITRVRHGIYWRKPQPTRFGPGAPDPVAVALKVAGPGSGFAGISAANALGLTTQVPAIPTIAVVGRAPKNLAGVKIVCRYLKRVDLRPTEVAVLETLRAFPQHVEADWSRLHWVVSGLVASSDVDATRLRAAAKADHTAGLSDRLDRALA